LLGVFEQPGLVAVLVAASTAVSALAGGVLLEIARGWRQGAERRQRARTQEMRRQLDLLYKPLLRILEAHSVPSVPAPDPEDWEGMVKPRLLEAFKIVDEHLEYADEELAGLLYQYRDQLAFGDPDRFDALRTLHQHVRARFDELRRQLYITPSQARPSAFARVRERVGWWIWGRWRHKRLRPRSR
jgi:hypothetical protein